MSLRTCISALLAWTLTLVTCPCQAAVDDQTKSLTFEQHIRPILRAHCFDCHGAKKQESELDFRRFPGEKELLADRKTWESVLEMVETEAMPPADRPRLSTDDG